VFAPMHWNAQFLGSGGINETTTPAVDPYSKQPELKHAAVSVQAVELPWRFGAAQRTGDAPTLQAALQPLLAGRRYASTHIETADDGCEIVVVTAADHESDDTWVERMHDALQMARDVDLLEYRDTRRGHCKRVTWRDTLVDGYLLSGDATGAQGLLARLRAATAWQGPRHTVFLEGPRVERERIVCNCRHVSETRIADAIAAGADLAALKSTLGCGSVCGSCMPEIRRLYSTTRSTTHMTALQDENGSLAP